MSHRYDLKRPVSKFDHWLELTRISEDQLKVEKKDSKPVSNEDKYVFKMRGDEIEKQESGKHKCSRGWRSTTAGDKLRKEVEQAVEEL